MLGWLLAALAGVALRGYRLRDQILTGDELHALDGALSRGLGEILRTWTYHGADYSVPLTALYRLLLDRGVVLTETILRAPILLASVLTIAVVPWLLRPRIGRAPALVLSWLVAISPMLVLYGRMVRSYAPAVLAAACAIVAFDRWWRGRTKRAAAAYGLAATLASYLHLGAASFVLSPFLFAVCVTLGDWKRRRAELPGLAALLAGVAAGLGLCLLPAMGSIVALTDLHGKGQLPDAGTWLDVLHLQVGTAHSVLVAALALAAVRGAAILARRDRPFALLLAIAALGHVAGLAILAPNFLQASVVMNRYLLVLLPFFLALVALGLSAPLRGVGLRVRAVQAVAVAVLLATLFALGPLAGREYRWSSYTHAQPFLNFTRPGDRVPPDRVPRFYRELPPGEEPLLEVPWTNVGTHSFNAYQHVHRRPLRVASLDPLHADPRLALRNLVPARPEWLPRSGARYVVVHLDLRREELQVTTSELRHRERLERLPRLWQVLQRGGARLAARLREEWGDPVYSDESIRVWDLASVSSGSAEPR